MTNKELKRQNKQLLDALHRMMCAIDNPDDVSDFEGAADEARDVLSYNGLETDHALLHRS